MVTAVKNIIEQILTLSPKERVKVVDSVLDSLDAADAVVDELWSREAEARIDAFDAGEIESAPAESVLGKYRQA